MYNPNHDPRMQSGGTGSATASALLQRPEVITEPTMLMKAEELLKHIDGLEREHSRLRGNLIGGGPESGQAIPQASTVEGMLSQACSRVACLVGDAATLNGCIG